MSAETLEPTLGHRFKDSELLREALTHKSYASEHRLERCNERLEFLGDSVLALIVSDELFKRYPGDTEGRLSKLKSELVSRSSIARWGKELDLGRHLYLGAGEESTGGRARPSIMGNALEAVLGAMYLDGGLEPPARMIREWLDQRGSLEETDHKSRLQELMQKKHKEPPTYDLNEASGPDHDKTFSVTVRMGRRILGKGTGKTKKEAEQAAAEDALSGIEA